VGVLDGLVDGEELIFEVLDSLLGLLVVLGLLLLLLFLAFFSLFTLLGALFLDGFTELDVDGDLIELAEVARDGDLDDRGVVLEIE
jgi:hypothetical protein